MSETWRKWVVLGGTALLALLLIVRNVPHTTLVIDVFEEMLLFERDEASTANGIWIMWSTPTFDFEEPMKTGYFHYSALLLGAVLVPFLGADFSTFALAAHWNSLLHAAAIVLAAGWLLGRLSNWSPLALLAPLMLAVNPYINARAAELRVDSAMMFWEILALWAMARFWVKPDKPTFKLALVLLTLGFAAKPTLLLLFPFFIALNLAQAWWDKQALWPEFRWRLRKGLKYGFVTFLIASPNNLFSLGLFVSSLRAEMAMSSEKYATRSGWDWLGFALDEQYLGSSLLALAGALALWLLWQHATGRGPWRRTVLDALVGLCLLWTVAYWAFLVAVSRSFIERYMDPGGISLLLFVGAALVRLGGSAGPRGQQRWRPVLALALALAALGPAMPAWWQAHQLFGSRAHAAALALEPAREQREWLSNLVPQDSAIMASPDVYLDPSHFPVHTRFFRFKPHYFDIGPEYLAISQTRLDTHRGYLGQTIDLDNKEQVERKLSAYFFRAISTQNLYGTLELVESWSKPQIHVYRFTKPVDAAYRDWLSARIHEEAGIPLTR